jgi:hypothetical protein
MLMLMPQLVVPVMMECLPRNVKCQEYGTISGESIWCINYFIYSQHIMYHCNGIWLMVVVMLLDHELYAHVNYYPTRAQSDIYRVDRGTGRTIWWC